jgi:Tol biopolymer transport system component
MYVAGQNGDLFVMPAFGGTARKLADDAYDPTWSPDGTRLAFRSIRDGSWRLYTVALDGSQLTRISGVDPRAFAPAWSPRRPLDRIRRWCQRSDGLGCLCDTRERRDACSDHA